MNNNEEDKKERHSNKYRMVDTILDCIELDIKEYLAGYFSFPTLLRYIFIDLMELRAVRKLRERK